MRWFLVKSVLLTALSFSATLCAGDRPAEPGAIIADSSLIVSQVGKSKVPVFSSVDGYVCFFLTADVIRPAKRKIGIFSVPKHGLAIDTMSLDFRRTSVTPEDWLKILGLIEPLEQMELISQLKVHLPDVPDGYNGVTMPRIYQNKLYVPLANHTDHFLVIGHSPKENKFYWKLKTPETFAYEF
jgi:hypothetical protein